MLLPTPRGLLVALLLLTTPPILAGTIAIEWSPVKYPDVAGYRVYHGYAPGSYFETFDVAGSLSATVAGAVDCTQHYVAVKTLDGNGAESATFSNEVSGWPSPSTSLVVPQIVPAGLATTLVLSGANFQPGAVVESGDPAILVGPATVGGCWSLQAPIAVSVDAKPGPHQLRVVNPDGVYGAFTINVDLGIPGPTDQLVLYFDMNLPSIAGTTILDRSPNNVPARIVDAPVAPGRFDEALRFGASAAPNSRIVVEHDPDLHLGSQFTIAAWIHPESLGEGSGGAILDKFVEDLGQGYALRLTGFAGLALLGVRDRLPVQSPTGIVRLDQWQHVAVVYNASTASFYVDGELVGSATGTNAPRQANLKMLVGTSAGSTRDFDGRVDEVRIYRRVLTPAEIAELQVIAPYECIDEDGDGYGSADSDGCLPELPADCDDYDGAIFPGAVEGCGDGIDQDCDGTDEICPCQDADGDGYGSDDCGGPDCDDADAWVYPGQDEICNDAVDQDCDGADTPCPCYDSDGDGHKNAACGGTDCDDTDHAVHPGASEICDGRDNNCDAEVDGPGVCASLIAHWSMDATSVSGATLLDQSGNGHHAQIAGATLTTGRHGEALRFVAGEDDYVRAPDHDALELGAEFTLEAWVYAESYGQGSLGAILDKRYATTGEGFRFSPNNVSGAGGLMFQGLSGQNMAYSSPGVMKLWEWVHVAVTYDSPVLRFYVNGVQVGSYLAYHDVRPSIRELHIGNDSTRSRDFNGLIDEVRIWNRALTADELWNWALEP